jgi:hypothetical protein
MKFASNLESIFDRSLSNINLYSFTSYSIILEIIFSPKLYLDVNAINDSIFSKSFFCFESVSI